MRRRRLGIGMGMTEHLERIELPHDADGRAVVPAVEHAFETRQGNAVFKRDAKIAHFLRHEPRRLALPETRLGVG
jgi:hypothetical protein